MQLKANRKDYQTEANKLAQAIDIAIESIQKHPLPSWNKEHTDKFIEFYNNNRDAALNPKPGYKRLDSLKYIIEECFSFFNESSGECVEYFWHRIEDHGLNFQRDDKIEKALKRGEIKDRFEYEIIIDTIIPAIQSVKINSLQKEQLEKMIGVFESKLEK